MHNKTIVHSAFPYFEFLDAQLLILRYQFQNLVQSALASTNRKNTAVSVSHLRSFFEKAHVYIANGFLQLGHLQNAVVSALRSG